MLADETADNIENSEVGIDIQNGWGEEREEQYQTAGDETGDSVMDKKIDDWCNEDVKHEVEKEPELEVVFVEKNACQDVLGGGCEEFAS